MGGRARHPFSRGSPELFLIVFLERAARSPLFLVRLRGAELNLT
jgi:hypothetical protein